MKRERCSVRSPDDEIKMEGVFEETKTLDYRNR